MPLRIKILLTAFLLIAILVVVIFLNSFNVFGTWDQTLQSILGKSNWPQDFEKIEIPSRNGDEDQPAYFYKSTSGKVEPLIVSLHSWSGDYSQLDSLAILSKQRNYNYIHPDFQGPNNHRDACCSQLVIENVESAIKYALDHANVDASKIYVVGASGGGYTALCIYLQSNFPIAKFSVWASITDLEQWYYESLELNNEYYKDILNCTGHDSDTINRNAMRERSPLHMKSEASRLNTSQLKLFAGIKDGVTGSVPYRHSINFYNKLLSDLQVRDSTKYVSAHELKKLESNKKVSDNFGQIADRDIYLTRSHENIELFIFDGGHEILPAFALQNLLEN